MSLSPKPTEHIVLPFCYQGWYDLTSVHWRVPVEAVRALVPAELEIDLFEGEAYVGILPFEVCHLHPPFLPPIPWISRFLETNLRTYVRAKDGSAGVWFFSLDADRLIDVLFAQVLYRLPYKWSAMRRKGEASHRHYEHLRKWPAPQLTHSNMTVEIGAPIPPDEVTDLEIFLSARWRLFTIIGGRMHYAQVEHEVWPFHRAKLVHLKQNLFEAAGLPAPTGDPLVLYSPGVNARVTLPRLLR